LRSDLALANRVFCAIAIVALAANLMAAATLLPPSPEGFTLAHSQELAQASQRAVKVRNAARVAAFNGWISALVALCSAPFAIYGVDGLVVAVALAIVAWNEFRGRKGLLSFDPSAATLLGWNQLGFLATIIVYCLWALYSNLTGSNPLAADLKSSPAIGEAFGGVHGVEEIFRQIVVAFYGLVILLSVIFQGGNAYYYFTRRKYVQAYLEETPAWVREVQSASLLS
jgi:hypothetical protein